MACDTSNVTKNDFESVTKKSDKMPTVDVIFVSDDFVGEMVLSRKDYEKKQLRKHKENLKESGEEVIVTPKVRKRKSAIEVTDTPKKIKIEDELELALAALENDEVVQESVHKPTELYDEFGDISARKMYSFESKKTPAKSPLSKTVVSRAINVTPNAKIGKLEKIDEEMQQTPYSLRKRVISDIKEIQKILENSDDDKDFSPSGSEYSAESSEEEAEEDENTNDRSKYSYFNAKRSSKNSSGLTLKNLSTPKLSREAVDNIFKELSIDASHKVHMTQLFRDQVALFEKWDFLLRHNYNVLLYGVGSKKDIIDKFLGRFSKENPIIKVNGFFPSVTIKDILDQICECLKIDSISADSLDKIEAKLENYDVRIYIGINNIDGIMLRNKKSQQVLASLARLPQVRIVATVDHINSPLMWDQCVLTDLNWAWIDSTTFLPYTVETSYEGSILLHPSGQLTLASLRSVFNSLTRNARSLFLILARAQASADKGWQGMPFRELYHEGRKQLLVSADSALRLQLKEFIDHCVVKQKRSAEGEERFLITMDSSILKQFIDEQDNN